MKKIATALLAMILCGAAWAQSQLDFSDPVLPFVSSVQKEGKATSGHSVSANILGVEYSYEQALGGEWSLIVRAGLPSVLTMARITLNVSGTGDIIGEKYDFSIGPRPGITLEPRFYFNKMERALLGKNTANNCANFWSLRTTLYLQDLDSPGHQSLSLIPMFGMRRGHEHWFREYTFGAGFHTVSYGDTGGRIPFLPHVNFRIGYTF